MMIKIAITGGRDFNDYGKVSCALQTLLDGWGKIDLIIHGDARGADRLAGTWAREMGIHECKVPALWDTYPKAAGPIRNRIMVDMQPDLLVAFPGGKGTADMIEQCQKANITIWSVYQ